MFSSAPKNLGGAAATADFCEVLFGRETPELGGPDDLRQHISGESKHSCCPEHWSLRVSTCLRSQHINFGHFHPLEEMTPKLSDQIGGCPERIFRISWIGLAGHSLNLKRKGDFPGVCLHFPAEAFWDPQIFFLGGR